jgi:cell wall-associated NlpC family hydrolase
VREPRSNLAGTLAIGLVLFLAAPHLAPTLERAGVAARLRQAVHGLGTVAGALPPGPHPAARPAPAAARAVAFARAQLGKPYRWGAAGPAAFDCSGLTQAAYAHAGVPLPRTADAQWQAGPHMTGRLAAGDLVFFQTARVPAGHAGHVGVYLGGGRMLEAPGAGQRLRVGSLHRAGYLGATRPAAGRPGR